MRFRRGDRSNEAVGYRIRLVVIMSHKPQNDMARKLGIDPSNITHWQTGANPPGIPTAQQIKDLYRVTLDYLFDGDWDGLPAQILEQLDEAESAELKKVTPAQAAAQ